MRILMLMLLSCLSSAVSAGVMFEPYAGYTTGNISVNGASTHPLVEVQTLESKGTIDGLAYGGRLALTHRSFLLGADYQGMRAKLKLKGVDEAQDWNSTAVFGIVGWQFFSGLRIYAGMTVMDYKATQATSPDELMFTGSARKIGIGYKYSSPVAVNLEYVEYHFDDFEVGAFKGKVKENYEKLDYSTVILAVSFPFYLGF